MSQDNEETRGRAADVVEEPVTGEQSVTDSGAGDGAGPEASADEEEEVVDAEVVEGDEKA